MRDIRFDFTTALSEEELMKYADSAQEANHALHAGTRKGNDFLGWVNLPTAIQTQIDDIQQTAQALRAECDIIVCIGIGGSYLGTKAVIESLQSSFATNNTQETQIIYAGQNIGEDYIYELQQYLSGKRFGIICISKSGTTTEPAIAFRLLKTQLEKEQGKVKAQKRIVCITDAKKGALRTLADKEGYKTYVIEDNIGGRYSVLSPVGLLPIACAGWDISQLIAGAVRMETLTHDNTTLQDNPAQQYAVARNILYSQKGKKIEMLVNFHPKLHFFTEWWKQLYGESEGKENKGIFPSGADFTTDLHSMGQYIQEGERHLIETFLSVEKTHYHVEVPHDGDNLDGLNFLAGKRIDEVNKMAELGTILAHEDGGIPTMKISIPELNEYYLGELIYFFEKACGISGYLLGVNPFNQPGVEAYKKNMFALLHKPGYEKETLAIEKRIQR